MKFEYRDLAVTLPDSVRCRAPQSKVFQKNWVVGASAISLEVTLRWDDTLGNNKNSFSFICYKKETSVKSSSLRGELVGIDEKEIAEHFPDLVEYLPFRHMFSDGPLHYLANTLFLAGARDCWGGLKGIQSKTKEGTLRWMLPSSPFTFKSSNERPLPYVNEFQAVLSEGKSRDLHRARALLAVPITDEELLQEPDKLAELLRTRHPELPASRIADITYVAGDRDFHGLRANEQRRTKEGLMWQQVARPYEIRFGPEKPAAVVQEFAPVLGEGKSRELELARSAAVWPEATDEQLMLPSEELAKLLVLRLPALMERFKHLVEKLGFVY